MSVAAPEPPLRHPPSFLVVGAAKAGTTALHEYLSQHPQIHVPARQEPSFFAFEGQRLDFRGPHGTAASVNSTTVRSASEYDALFADADDATASGEVSPVYLYWRGTAERIHARVPSVRLCVLLRHPVDRAFSAFMHAHRENKEPLADFRAALAAEPERIEERWGFLWRYADMGCYAAQLRRYLRVFPRDQVMVALYDDLQADPIALCQRVYRFIGVDPTFRPDVSVRHNMSGVPRSPLLQSLLRRNGPLAGAARTVAPLVGRQRLRRAQVRATSRNLQRRHLPTEQRTELVERFRGDIEAVERLVDRDLSHWYAPSGSLDARSHPPVGR